MLKRIKRHQKNIQQRSIHEQMLKYLEMTASLYTEYQENILADSVRLTKLLFCVYRGLPVSTLYRTFNVLLVSTLHDKVPGSGVEVKFDEL